MSEEEIKTATDKALAEELESRNNEIQWLRDYIGHLGTEIFYRKNPECRPKN